MKKIRVLQAIGNLCIGGAENVAMNFYRYIDREKFEFHYLVYGYEKGFYEAEVEELGGKVIHMDEPSKDYIKFTGKLEAIMKDNGPYDIIHSHTLFNSGFVLEAARRVGINRRIAHSHSIKNRVYTNKLIQVYEMYMRFKIRKNATDYFACSKDAGSFLFGESEFNNKGKIIKNGIDIKKYRFNQNIRNKARKKFNIADKFVVGHVGHLASVKNQLFLIDIFKSLSNKRGDVVLMLVGDGNGRNEIEERIKEYNLNSSVILTGNRNDVNELLHAMDVFVFPSLYEGLGLAVIEAQTSGLPCIVSDRVPKEAFLSNIIHEVSLDQSADYWADVIETYKCGERQHYYKKVEEEGYDIESIGKFVEGLYIREE